MSGEAQVRRRTGQNKMAEGSKTGEGSPRYSEDSPSSRSSSAGCLVKIIFFILLSIFLVFVSLEAVDYKSGQLEAIYLQNTSPEIRQSIGNAANFIRDLGVTVNTNFWRGYNNGMSKMREYARQIKVGDGDLEELLFMDEIIAEEEKETLEKREALDKLKKVVEKSNANIKVEAKTEEQKAREREELEKEVKEWQKKVEEEKQQQELERKQQEALKKQNKEKERREEQQRQELARKKQEAEEQKRKEEIKKKEESERRKQELEEQQRKEEAEKKKQEAEEQKRKQEAERKKLEAEEQKKKAEAERKRQEAKEQKKKQDAEEQKKKEESERKKQEAEEQKRKKEAERKNQEAEELKKKAEAERKKQEAEEQRKKEEAERKKQESEEQKRKQEEERKNQEAEMQKRKEELKTKPEGGNEIKEPNADKMKKEQELKLETERKIREQQLKDAEENRKRLEEDRKKRAEETRRLQEQLEKERIKKEQELEAEKKKDAEEAQRLQEKQKREEESARKKRSMEDNMQKKKLEKAEEALNTQMNRDQADKIGQKKANEEKLERQIPSHKQDSVRIDAAREAGKLAKDMAAEPGVQKIPQDLLDFRLKAAEAIIKTSPEVALEEYDEIIRETRNGYPEAVYGKALAWDELSDQKKSNKHLEEAIRIYLEFLEHPKSVSKELKFQVMRRVVDRMNFRGWSKKAVDMLKKFLLKYPENPELMNLLGTQYVIIGRTKEAQEMYGQVLALDPLNNYAARHLGYILKTGGKSTENVERGVALLYQGVMGGESGENVEAKFYFHLGYGLIELGRQEEADIVFERGVEKGLFLSFWQRSLYNVGRLTGKPLWTKEETGLGSKFRTLEDNWKVIRDEGLAILNSFKTSGENLHDSGDWGQLDLFKRGQQQKACEKAPRTCELVSQIPEATTNRRGQIKFSVLYPGTHIKAHSGPTNTRLRAHLALSVPSSKTIPGQLRMRLTDMNIEWEEGKVLVFDDSFDHEVWHFRGDQPRLVLIVDIWHPEIDDTEKNSLSVM